MKSITHGRRARDPLLHIEADGVLVNIRVGLTDTEGHHVTRVDISPDDETRGGDGEGFVWYQDGARIVRLERDESRPTTPRGDGLVAAVLTAAQQEAIEFYRALNVPGQWFVGVPDEHGEVEVICLGQDFAWSIIVAADGSDVRTTEARLGDFSTGIEA